MKAMTIGDIVNYHSLATKPATSFNHKILRIERQPNAFGEDVAWISEKAGCVSMEHLSHSAGATNE
jgi:hypothetical protein